MANNNRHKSVLDLKGVVILNVNTQFYSIFYYLISHFSFRYYSKKKFYYKIKKKSEIEKIKIKINIFFINKCECLKIKNKK